MRLNALPRSEPGQNEQQGQDNFAIAPALDVERAILGCLMLNPGEALQEIIRIRPEHFYGEDDRKIYRAILALAEKGVTPDMTLVYRQDESLSPTALGRITGEACFPSQIGHYADLLLKNCRGRRLEGALLQSHAELAGGTDYERVEEYLIGALSQDRAEAETFGIAEGYDVQNLLDGGEKVSGVLSGLNEIDTATAGGIKPGEVCIAAARTSVGKSAFAVMWAAQAVSHGTPVLYMSYEMPRQQVWRRLLSYWSRVSLRKFRQGFFDTYDRPRVDRAYQDLQQGGYLPMIRVNCKANKPGDLLRLVRMEQLRFGANLFVIVDHAGRMQSDNKARSDYERSSEIANRLKDMALSCNIPMLVLWQLNRAVEKTQDKTPTLADLRDTGQAEEIADSVLLMSRDSYYDSTILLQDATVTTDVAKARDGGKTGKVKVRWLDIISRPETREAGES